MTDETLADIHYDKEEAEYYASNDRFFRWTVPNRNCGEHHAENLA